MGALSVKLDRAALVGAPIMIKARPLNAISKWFELTSTSSSFTVPHISLSYLSLSQLSWSCCCSHVSCIVVSVFQLCCLPGSQAALQMGSRFGEEDNSLLLVLLLSCGKGSYKAVEC